MSPVVRDGGATPPAEAETASGVYRSRERVYGDDVHGTTVLLYAVGDAIPEAEARRQGLLDGPPQDGSADPPARARVAAARRSPLVELLRLAADRGRYKVELVPTASRRDGADLTLRVIDERPKHGPAVTFAETTARGVSQRAIDTAAREALATMSEPESR